MCVQLGRTNVIFAPPRKWPKTIMLKYAYLSYKTLKEVSATECIYL